MNARTEISRISGSLAKTIVDNVNNVLGILPKTLSFEVSMPMKKRRVRAHRAKARKVHARVGVAKKVKRAGVRLKHKVKAAVAKPKRRKSATIIALKRKPQGHVSHKRAA